MPRRCKQCKTELPPARQCTDIIEKKGFCGVECLTAHTRDKLQKAQRRKKRQALRRDRERLKTRSEHARDAQRAFNAAIRERDRDKPCISCGRHHKGQYHAGHYRTVGANPELRFEELNCHKQCAPCNNHKSGDIVNYRINLIERIGQDAVDWLEGPHKPKKYTVDELKEIGAYYRKKTRELKKSK